MGQDREYGCHYLEAAVKRIHGAAASGHKTGVLALCDTAAMPHRTSLLAVRLCFQQPLYYQATGADEHDPPGAQAPGLVRDRHLFQRRRRQHWLIKRHVQPRQRSRLHRQCRLCFVCICTGRGSGGAMGRGLGEPVRLSGLSRKGGGRTDSGIGSVIVCRVRWVRGESV